MGDYAGEQARWASTPVEVGRPLGKPTPIFAKLDPELGETGPSGRRSRGRRSPGERHVRHGAAPSAAPEPRRAPVVDAHTHLDACGCVDAADVGAALDRAAAVGVTRVVTVADDLASARWVVDAAHWDDRVAAAVALHPTRTAAVTDGDYAEIERLAADPRVVAVGETGLDHYWDYMRRGTRRSARSAGTSTSPSASASR